jgi:outer membrane protein OmpA-like peptidoglycan-associated protein
MIRAVCLGAIAGFLAACEPPAKPTNSAPVSSSRTIPATASSSSSVATVASVSAQPLASASASAAEPLHPPCPPEVPEPAEGLAWVSGCRILIRQKIVFDFDKATIKPSSYPIIDAVGDILLRNSDLRVEIEGHAGDKQRVRYGRVLSRDRAQSIFRYLVEKKSVPAAQLSAVGYENDKPVASNATEEGRARNRRIELVILRWGGQIR